MVELAASLRGRSRPTDGPPPGCGPAASEGRAGRRGGRRRRRHAAGRGYGGGDDQAVVVDVDSTPSSPTPRGGIVLATVTARRGAATVTTANGHVGNDRRHRRRRCRPPGDVRLVSAALDEVAGDGDGAVALVGARGPRPTTTRRPPQLGLTPGRRLLQLAGRCRPAARRVETRPFRPGVDEAAWVAVRTTGPSPTTPSRAAGRSTRWPSTRVRAVVRPRRVPAPRARRPAGRVLLDEAARPATSRRRARRDLRDRCRSGLPGPRPRPAS